MSIRLALLCTTLVFAFTQIYAAEGQKLYKWVDQDGNVHYSDTLPPQQVKQEHKVLNEQGITVDTVARAKTDEELAAEREALRQTKQRVHDEELVKADLARRDRILLSIYANEEDLFRARDHKLVALDSTIDVTRSNIRTQEASLENFMKEAADIERRGQVVSEHIKTAIKNLRAQIAENEAYIGRKEEEKNEITADYEVDLERFRELTGEGNQRALN
jgi:hypothetical protein